MNRFKGIWYNPDTVVKEDYVDATNEDEAKKKIFSMYEVDKRPAPLLSIEKVSVCEEG